MKPYVLFLLATLTLSACQANNISPTPTITPTLSLTETRPASTETETPTAIPESPELLMAEAVANGLKTYDIESWTGQYAQYADWYRLAQTNPEQVTDEQLDKLTVFMQDARTEIQRQFFAANPDAARIIEGDFLTGFAGYTREEVNAMSPEELRTKTYEQNERMRQFLELRFHALTGEETIFSPQEIMANETDPDSNPLFHEEWKNQIPVGNGFYGMWVNNAETFLENSESVTNDELVFHREMYGRYTERHGYLAGDDIAADYMGYWKKSDGVYYTYWMVKDDAGKSFLHTYLVVTDSSYAITIPEGSYVLGSFIPVDSIDNGVINRNVSLTTLYAYMNGNNRQQLTLEKLKEYHTWPPGFVKIASGGVSMTTGGYASQFFDPATGLMIIGSEVGGLDNGFLYFGKDVNPWP